MKDWWSLTVKFIYILFILVSGFRAWSLRVFNLLIKRQQEINRIVFCYATAPITPFSSSQQLERLFISHQPYRGEEWIRKQWTFACTNHYPRQFTTTNLSSVLPYLPIRIQNSTFIPFYYPLLHLYQFLTIHCFKSTTS